MIFAMVLVSTKVVDNYHILIVLNFHDLGTLDAPREGRDDGIEPEDSVGGLFLNMEGPLEYMPEQEMLTKWLSSKNTNLVLDPRQAPEYSKHPMFLQISLESFMFDTLGYKSWFEPLDA